MQWTVNFVPCREVVGQPLVVSLDVPLLRGSIYTQQGWNNYGCTLTLPSLKRTLQCMPDASDAYNDSSYSVFTDAGTCVQCFH